MMPWRPRGFLLLPLLLILATHFARGASGPSTPAAPPPFLAPQSEKVPASTPALAMDWKKHMQAAAKAQQEGRYAEAEKQFKDALNVAEGFGPEDPRVAVSLNNLAQLYRDHGKYAQAEPLYKRSLSILEKVWGPEDLGVATILENLEVLYYQRGDYAEAEPLYTRALAIREKVLGREHRDVATTLNNLALLYYAQGKYIEAEPLYKRALAIEEKILGPEHADVATILDNLAELYRAQGKYVEAEPLYKRALAIEEKVLGPKHPRLATTLNNLALLYGAQGQYAEAERLYKRALAIREKVLGPEHADVATSLNNLAGLYWPQGRYAEAEPLYARALAIAEKVLGPEHPLVATMLNNLALLYGDEGKYAEAEPLYKRSLAIWEKGLGPEHPNVGASLNNLADLYRSQGKYAEAEPLYKRSLAIAEKALGSEHAHVAASLNNLAQLYRDQGKYAQAEPLYKRSLAVLERTLGPEHPLVAASLENLGILYFAQDRPNDAQPAIERGLQNLARQFEYHFTYMSEKERLGFLDTVAGSFPVYFSFCLVYKDRDPSLIGKMYDVVLWQKGFIAQSIAALRTKVEASGDPRALELLDELSAKKTQLANLLSSEAKDRAQWRKQVEQLEQEANELERELVKRAGVMAEEKRLARASWRDVQKALGKDEAAVELVKFQFHDGKRWTEKTYYVALIVTPESTAAPGLVVLGEGNKLEGAAFQEYRKLIAPGRGSASGDSHTVYEAFWKPLEAPLAQRQRIYFSPDGLLNQISFGVLPTGDDQRLLEKYDLRLVSSTKDRLREKRATTSNVAVLIGNPRFDLEEGQQRMVARGLRKVEGSTTLLAAAASGLRSRDQQRGALAPLPGTQVELEALRSLLAKRSWPVEVYSGENALEEIIKRVQRPRVLHAATHGFFLPDQQVQARGLIVEAPSGREDPMLRSGLLFAGAERALRGGATPADLEDGVLTAYEVTGLNLQGTELVVLSACETGLGELKSGEGVFGLRRALQVAGAEAVLMSLWSVPDRETQELMTLFYEKWLSGKDKYEALREAQLEMRARVRARYGQDLPFYWGGFVLVGR